MTILMVRNLVAIDSPMEMKVSFASNILQVAFNFQERQEYKINLIDERPHFFEKLMPVIGDFIVSDLLYSVYWTQLATTVNTKDTKTITYFAACVERVIRSIIGRYEQFYGREIQSESNKIAIIDTCDHGHKFAKLPDHP